ncbi:MAG: TRAP transporter small permease [Paracoccus sp. (in: a-proteobacteria)]|nr:TRAP transporter small permease [Paracoccus sp. (in: a-proteobacteria)]
MSFRKLDKWAHAIAAFLALLGGAGLLAVVVVTCVSVIGRAITPFGPVRGDFEIVEIGAGFAIFCFLPWCHLLRANATVDLFEASFGDRLNRVQNLAGDLLMLVFAAVILWRMWVGMGEKLAYRETTIILQFPVWMTYALCMVGAVGLVIVSVFTVVKSTFKLGGG